YTGGTIDFAGYHLTVPNAVITFSTSATTATTVLNTVTNTWETTVPANYNGNVFLSGLAWQVPASGLPGGANPVVWSGKFGSTTTTGLSFQWKWAAAVYTSLAADPGVKAIDGNTGSPYLNSDHAGTPENFKSSVTGGARGGGGSNWTGSYSGTATVDCVA